MIDSIAELEPADQGSTESRPTGRELTRPTPSGAFGLSIHDLAELNHLPSVVQERIKELLTCVRIIDRAPSRRKAALTLQNDFQGARGYSAEALRRYHRRWVSGGRDWRALIDRARVPQARDESIGLPTAFKEFWFKLLALHKRSATQARHDLLRRWRTGHDDDGNKCPIPGYGFWRDWVLNAERGTGNAEQEECHVEQFQLPAEAPLPKGWNKSTLARLKPPGSAAQKLLAREGVAAARAVLPCNHSTRRGMKFMQEITFDDVKTDFRIVHDVNGDIQVCDLWLLIAQDRATGLVLCYWLLPAVAREDGTQTHLGLNEMKMLCGWLLDKWGLPPYVVKWKLERGTATLGKAIALAIAELFSERIDVSYNTMIGGTAPSGYAEKRKGNSQAKAGHEAMNNLLHNMCDHVPGQTGNLYTRRPAELWGRERHALEWARKIAECGVRNAESNLIQRAQWPVMTLDEARSMLNTTFNRMNARTEHRLEGYDWIYEWRCNTATEWQPIATCPAGGGEIEKRKRKHAPIERASQLCAGLEFTRVPAAVISRFFESTQRIAVISPRGEIVFRVQDRDYIFRPRTEQHLQPPFLPGAKFLAHWNPATQEVLHLSQLPPHRGYVDSWARYERVGSGDTAALEESIAYVQAVQRQQTDYAARLAGDEPARIAAIDAHNTALLADLTASVESRNELPESPLARAMVAVDAAVESTAAQRVQKARSDAALAATAEERMRKELLA